MSGEESEVVEIDAIAVEEWEHDQHTPMANDTNLAALVKQSATANSGPVKALDEGWDDLAVPQAAVAKPRTTTNTLRRSATASAVQAVTPPKTKTMAFPTALVKPAMPTKPVGVPKSIAPRPPSESGAASLAAGTAVPSQEAVTVKRSATARPASEPTPPKRPTAEAAPIAATATPSSPKRPTSEAAPNVASSKPAPTKRPTSEAAPVTTTPKPAVAPIHATPKPAAISKRPTSELTAKAKPAPEPIAAIPAPVSPPAIPAVQGSPFEAQLSSSDDDWLPAWPPAAHAPIAAEPVRPFEDWDDPSASTAIENRVAPTRAKPSGDDAFPAEDSVIIDLNAAPKAVAPTTPKRPQSQPVPVIQTSEQSTTTSGVFVMPTAAAPNAQQVPPSLASMADASALPERPSSPWQTPLPGPLPGEPAPARAVSPFSQTAAECALDYAAPAPVAPAPQWPSAAGLGYEVPFADASIPAPIAQHEPTSSLRAPLFTPKRKRIALLAGAGALVAILVIAMAGGNSKHAATIAKLETPTATTATAPTPSTPALTATAPTPAATAPATPTASQPAAAVAVAATTPATPKAASKAQPAKRRLAKTKKPVVVDYDKKPESSALDPDQSLAKARSIYAAGNQRLFAGDMGGAIAQYRQALAVYPTYAASYRGIGLAFAQQGNKPAALEAFKTYVKLAPMAKDIALIKKRIANLSVN